MATPAAAKRQPRPHRCVHCELVLTTKQGLRKHLRTHTNEMPFACTRGECDKRFRTKTTLRRHELTVHDKAEERLPCPECGKMLRPLSLLPHRQALHDVPLQGGGVKAPPKLLSCPAPGCDRTFKHRGNLNRHTMAVHNTCRTVYACLLCPTTRCTLASARNHMAKCAKRFGVPLPDADPIARAQNAPVMLRGTAAEPADADAAEDVDADPRPKKRTRRGTRDVGVEPLRGGVELLLRDEAKELPTGTHRCPFHDGATFTKEATLWAHMRAHKRLEGKHACPYCTTASFPNFQTPQFLTARKLQNHIRSYHANLIAASIDNTGALAAPSLMALGGGGTPAPPISARMK